MDLSPPLSSVCSFTNARIHVFCSWLCSQAGGGQSPEGQAEVNSRGFPVQTAWAVRQPLRPSGNPTREE